VWAVASVALTRQLIPVAFGAESRAGVVQRLTGTYDAYREAAARFPGTAALAGYPFPFHYPGRAIQLDVPWFALDSSEYRRRLGDLGIDYVLAAPPRFRGALHPLPPCAGRAATFQARYVTSRTRGTSEPLALSLFDVRGCH
jgi:hypothetical protein